MSAGAVRSGMVDSPDRFRREFGVSGAAMEKLETYARLLGQWRTAVNLISPESLSDAWARHFADSAQLMPLIADARTCLDFGSGAGFPGMVVAILSGDHPGRSVHLVESNARKCAFLREVARRTATAVEIHNTRIEEIAARGTVPHADVVMARGVAPLERLLELSAPFFTGGAVGLFPKGRRADEEVAEARKTWTFDLRSHPSATEPGGRILEIRSPERVKR